MSWNGVGWFRFRRSRACIGRCGGHSTTDDAAPNSATQYSTNRRDANQYTNKIAPIGVIVICKVDMKRQRQTSAARAGLKNEKQMMHTFLN